MAGKQNPAVQEALRLIDSGMNPYAAAKQAGAVQASVVLAAKRREAKVVACADDPEAALREMALAGKVDEVALIAGRLHLLTVELKAAQRGK